MNMMFNKKIFETEPHKAFRNWTSINKIKYPIKSITRKLDQAEHRISRCEGKRHGHLDPEALRTQKGCNTKEPYILYYI